MNDQLYHDFALEKTIKATFGVTAEIDTVIARNFPVSRTAEATLFLTKKKQLFLYIDSQSKLLLSDVQKIVSRVGLKAELYLPPKNRPHYFDEVGTEKFRDIFPGRGHINQQDIAFYRTLSPYSPALVLITEVKKGAIYQYDSDSSVQWRLNTKFTYRRIKTS
ncbi:MAG: hypothetical protein EOT05_02855 [Candidatus Microsaccharimonas sossegonensis]|uniref:Uncharacterized protein n=1 Tax=Candidatus Microsaccharimonas sossegonensis TaxID=2506948 RepID=A0A4Q0AHS2_9BACT|nr:MAG: hypothetical protein EOT05_02855 [Candidatus Microsaccharimonas sossegonensis]